MLVIALVAVCTPRSAEAARYVWLNVNDGQWTNSANWDDYDDPGEDPNDDGYPDGPGDVAYFVLAYTQPHTVVIPDAGVTVGEIHFDSHAITFVTSGPGVLRMQTDAAGGALILRLNPAPEGRSDQFDVPIELLSELTVNVAYAPSKVVFNRPIVNVGAFHGITKVGSGAVYMRANNDYQGVTNVVSGQLWLDADPDVSVIDGDLEIGSGVAGPGYVAEVVVNAWNQIVDTSSVRIKNQGRLQVNGWERVGHVIVNDGFIYVGTVYGFFMPQSITMSGGSIESAQGGNIRLDHGGITATSSVNGPANIWRSSGGGTLNLGNESDTFHVDDGPSATYDLSIDLPISQAAKCDVTKQGTGTLRYTSSNRYTGETVVNAGALWLESAGSITGTLIIGYQTQPALVDVRTTDAIANDVRAFVGKNGSLWVNASEFLYSVSTTLGTVAVGNKTNAARLVLAELLMEGGLVQMFHDNILEVSTALFATTVGSAPARIGGGNLLLGDATRFNVPGREEGAIEAFVSSKILIGGLKKLGRGVAVLSGNNAYAGATVIDQGGLLINGQQSNSPIVLNQGSLGGTGRAGLITVATGTVAPGTSPGRLSSSTVVFSPNTTFDVELNGTAADAYDQLAVNGTVTLGGAILNITAGAALPADGRWIIIDNDGTDPIAGIFGGLEEGAPLIIGGGDYTITYRGGDGNDVVIEPLEEEPPTTYYLAEGATGDFFDDDVLIANPNDVQAPVTLTFLREGGATVVVQRVIPAQSRVTIHVDQLEGLENVSASVTVESTDKLPLIVERSMFWDASYYSGHTANAVTKPEKRWTFAEGSQGGFFATYILIANANAAPTTVTLTFLRENETPVVKTLEVGPFARKTIGIGDYVELENRAFGIVVDATEPVMAERSMYFATRQDPVQLWRGGHVNTGTVAPSRSWFHAEGATGSFFNTFILLSNPQTTEAKVDVRFLLENGTVITRPKTLAPQQRLTINPAEEGDARLQNASVSTVVASDVPIVSERSMYWEGEAAKAIGEGHNSSGLAEAGLRWGLAEGRVGGDRNFVTYILLANPSTTAAKVRVSYLRESGAPIVQEYDVPATSRFNIDVGGVVPELLNTSFGAEIEVLNDVPIAVERSMYWDANGSLWAGGTNALATPLRPVP
jgi:autotransporter-associated beta strand protein